MTGKTRRKEAHDRKQAAHNKGQIQEQSKSDIKTEENSETVKQQENVKYRTSQDRNPTRAGETYNG